MSEINLDKIEKDMEKEEKKVEKAVEKEKWSFANSSKTFKVTMIIGAVAVVALAGLYVWASI